jgi:hypothetical protein
VTNIRPVRALLALFALAAAGFAQVPASNANSFELDNGVETFATFVATSVQTTGNVAGTGIVNLTPGDQMFWEILPKELMHSSNGTVPGTMELTSMEVSLLHTFFGSNGGGTPSVRWDMTIHPVTYINPLSGAGPDNRRYPNLAVTPIVTILGGPTGLPAPTGCPAPGSWIYNLSVELGTAVPGSGIFLPADGNTDLAWTFWSPGGMSALPADPTGCEVGGNLSVMAMISTNEHVPPGVTTGAATPTPAGNNRNPFYGSRGNAGAFNNVPNNVAWMARPGFREPVLQFRYHYGTGAPTVGGSMPTPQRGSGAMYMDATSPAATVLPGFRTCASGHLGELVIHVVTTDLTNFQVFSPPGLPVTPTANLMLNPSDPNFFLLTPALDVFLGVNSTDYFFAQKHTADTPLLLGLAGPIPPPGLQFAVQAFVVNIAGGPPFSVVSTNVARGTIW